ncbi:hypothetical protein LPE509_02819 [Legionella pneumophila subsp. pneumophila LPE509]|nr:hypothetical protein LPE509_02819 [Legionella pneumophila subsp. pneumophila LPE509]
MAKQSGQSVKHCEFPCQCLQKLCLARFLLILVFIKRNFSVLIITC